MTKSRDKNVKGAPRKGSRPAGLRMKELATATGLPKSAILHYVAQGLLPEPLRTGPNMAYYDPSCIERVAFIRAMQDKYAFPLGKIKMLLSHREQGMDVTPLIELSATIFGNAETTTMSEAELRRETGLEAGQVRALMEAGLLIPLDGGKFNQQDATIGGIYARCFSRGATAADFSFYAEAAVMIVDREMRLRHKLTAHLPEDEDAEMTRQMVMGARLVRNYVIERTFQQRVAAAGGLKDENLLSGPHAETRSTRRTVK